MLDWMVVAKVSLFWNVDLCLAASFHFFFKTIISIEIFQTLKYTILIKFHGISMPPKKWNDSIFFSGNHYHDQINPKSMVFNAPTHRRFPLPQAMLPSCSWSQQPWASLMRRNAFWRPKSSEKTRRNAGFFLMGRMGWMMNVCFDWYHIGVWLRFFLKFG